MKKVLIIEDDTDLSNLIQIHIKDLSYEVVQAFEGNEGFERAKSAEFDLIILDVMLPQKNGLDIAKELRMGGIHTPILMLTAKSEEIDKILGLEFGADDYMTKPFSTRELTARVKAMIRRQELWDKNQQKEKESSRLEFEKLCVDIQKRIVTYDEQRIELSPKEFDLLVKLASHPGQSFSREQLLSDVWGYQYQGYEHTVNSHINRLRSKIEPDILKPRFILTTWGVGYRFADYDELEIEKNDPSI